MNNVEESVLNCRDQNSTETPPNHKRRAEDVVDVMSAITLRLDTKRRLVLLINKQALHSVCFMQHNTDRAALMQH